jgi:hypothetical protein
VVYISRRKQKEWFEELKEFETNPANADNKDILKTIYPSILEHVESGVQFFSQLLMRTCAKIDIDSTDHIRYVIVVMLLQNLLYCNQITSIIHSVCSSIKGVLSPLDTRLLAVLFAGVLYGFFKSSGAARDKVIKMFKIKFKKETDMDAVISNQVVLFFVNILAACMIIFVPLCSILSVACLFSSTYVLGKNIIAPYNKTIWIFCLLTILLSMGTYVSLSLMVGGVMNPKDLISFNKASAFSLFIMLFSVVGVGLPLCSAIGYAGYTSVKIFMSFLSFLKMDIVYQRILKSIPSLVMIALFLLSMHVRKVLGQTYFFITLSIIGLIGAYVWVTKSGKSS